MAMLRKVIAGLIERVIGSYVEDVNGEKLSIGLLNGNLALNRLTLKSDTLHRLLDIPLVLEKGTIGQISVHIPYTHLWSQPWQLRIEDVELVAYLSASELQDRHTHKPETTEQSPGGQSVRSSDKAPQFDQKYYLAQMEEKWWKTIHSTGVNDATALAAAVAMGSDADTSSWLSYLASFGYAIVRSIQIEIHNVHLRIIQQGGSTNPRLDHELTPPSLFGAFTISLEHLTVKTAEMGNQENDTECKLIKMVNFCIKWSEVDGCNPLSTNSSVQPIDDNLLYVLPPSSLTGQLKRSRIHAPARHGTSVDRSARNRLVQLEFDTSLGDLKLQLSRDLCKASVQLAELVSWEQQKMEQFSRRPKVTVHSNAVQWWKYAAGEIRPQLRPRFNSTMRINLTELANEAKLNLLYVDAYTNYLVRGLTTLYCPSAEQAGSIESTASSPSESDAGDQFRRCVADEEWPVGRIAALRLVAMRRAASVLHEFVKPQRLRKPTVVSSTNDSLLSLPSHVEGEQGNQQNQVSESTSSGTMSWYAWWRYSSLLGIRTLWYGSDTADGGKPSQSDLSPRTASPQEQSTAESPPTVKEAIFELLDELALTSDLTGETKPPGYAAEGDLVAFRLVCRVVGCSVRLVENEFQFAPTSEFVHPAFVSVSGESMQFTLEAEPWQRSLRFAASVESFTVRDERHLVAHTNLGHLNSRPTFPFVVFPQPHFISRPAIIRSSSSVEPTTEQAKSSGLFWLVYEVLPPGSNFDYSLEIKTDPLHVVYQPELIRCVVNFLQTVASAASLDLESSARLQYEVIKQRTRANLRAILDETVKLSGSSQPDTFISQTERGSSPLAASRQPTIKQKRPKRWRLQLDISAPRLLLPNRFSENVEAAGLESRHPSPVIGLLCNFGHLKVSNWPVSEASGWTRSAPPETTTKSARSTEEDDDLFLTPCGTPDTQSDAELDDEDTEPGTVPTLDQPNGDPGSTLSPQLNLYQSYVIHLDDLHVLVGPLNMLKKLGLWTNPEESQTGDNASDSRGQIDSTDFEQEVLSPTSSRLLAQLSIVDRINLRLIVSRRVIAFPELIRRYKVLSDQTIECPPALWITLEQERCVLQLSDSKINNLLTCLRPKRESSCRNVSENQQDTIALSTSQSPDPNSPSWQRPPRSRARSEILLPSKQPRENRPAVQQFSSQRKRFIANFSVAELIVQLENKGYPTAEFRLEGFAGTWIRLTGQRAGYQGRIQLRNFSIADAVTNLGGEYDLIVAAHKDVRLNDSGHLEIRSTSSELPGNASSDHSQRDLHPLVQPPQGHVQPILEFPDNKDVTSHLIRCYFELAPGSGLGNAGHVIDDGPKVPSRRTIRMHIHCLDVVFNPTTLNEIYSCVHYLTSLSEIFPTSSKSMDDTPPSTEPSPHSTLTELDARLTVDRLSMLVIRVSPSVSTTVDATEGAIPHGNLCRADRIVLATLNKINISSEFDMSYQTVSFRLDGLRILDLTQNSSRYRYILTAGSVSQNSCAPSVSGNDPVNTPATFVVRKPSWQTGVRDQREVSLLVPYFTYVHSSETLDQLITWTQTLPSLKVGRQEDTTAASSEPSLDPTCYLFSTKLRYAFTLPVLVIPDQIASSHYSSRALIARLHAIHLTNPTCSSGCSEQLTNTNRLYLRFDLAELLSVEFAKFPALHLSSPLLAERMIHFYRSSTCPNSSGASSGIEQILTPTSGSLWLTSTCSSSWTPQWHSSFTMNPSYFFSEVPSHDRYHDNSPSESIESSAVKSHLFILESTIDRAVCLYLTKPVCSHLIKFVQSLSSLRTRLASFSGFSQLPQLDSTPNHFSFCLTLPSLQLDTTSDLDVNPVPLARLRLTDLVAKFIQAPPTTPHSSSCGELFVRQLELYDLLPTENGSAPSVDPILLSILPTVSTQASNLPQTMTTSRPNLTTIQESTRILNLPRTPPFLAVSDLHLSPCNICTAYANLESALELTNGAALHIQLFVLSTRMETGIPQRFQQVKRFLHTQCSEVFCRLRPQPWVLLRDFFNFSESNAVAVPMHLQSSLNAVDEASESEPRAVVATDAEPTLVSVKSEKFSIVLTTPASCDDLPPCDLATFSGHIAHLYLLNHVDQFEPHLATDRQFIPDNFPGPFYLVEGELCDLKLLASRTEDCSLYNERFCMRATPADPVLLFRLLRSRKPAPGNLEINGYFWARIAPSIYVHTQSFLVALLDSIIDLFQQGDLFTRARQSAEGLKINTQSPTSPLFLLDIVCPDPQLVLPVSSYSREALVAVMDKLSVKTSCLCTHDEVDFISPVDDIRRYRPRCFQRISVADPSFRCLCCSSDLVREEPNSPKSTTSSSKMSFRGFQSADDLSDTGGLELSSCVLERIHIDLSNALVYHGVHRSKVDLLESELEASNITVPSDQLVQCLHFADYVVTRSEQPNQHRRTLFDLKSFQFRLERNLHSAQSHGVPDWRLVAPLADMQLHLNEHIYSVIRGILSHNFGDGRKANEDESTEVPLLDRTTMPPVRAFSQPAYYPPKTAITGIPWVVFSFEIPMENIRLLCFDANHTSTDSDAQFRIDFDLACFSLDAMSDQRTFLELRCPNARVVDPLPNRAIFAPLIPIPHAEMQPSGAKSVSPLVYRFWLRFLMAQQSSELWLHLDRMRLLYHHPVLSRLLNYLKLPPSSKCAPMDLAQSSTSFTYQVFLEKSELKFVEQPNSVKSGGILLKGSAFLAHSSLRGDWKPSVPCAHLCLHKFHLRLIHDQRCSRRKYSIFYLPLVRVDLAIDHPSTVPTSSAIRRKSSHPLSLSNTVSTGRFWKDWTNWQHMDSTPPPRPPKLNLVCITSNLSLRMSSCVAQQLTSITRVIQRQINGCDDPTNLSAPQFSQAKLSAHSEYELAVQHVPFSVASWIQRLDSFAEWISPFLQDIQIQSGLSLRIFRSELGSFVPLFDALIQKLTLTWHREQPSPIGALKVDCLALNYFNRDLVAWEPAVEPWSCSLEWYQMLTDSFTKTSTVMFTSPETLNLNLTVPLCLLIRRLAEPIHDMTDHDHTPAPSPTPSTPTEPVAVTNPTDGAPFRLLNRTGCKVSFKVLSMNEMEGLFENERCAVEEESLQWYHVDSTPALVDIPSIIPQGKHSQDTSVLLTDPPILLLCVVGWKPTYPISVDRLGVYFRTLERDDTDEASDDEEAFLLEDHLPQFTRLVIEVVRTGPSVQHVIVLRSGLTITNDLADGHQLLVGLQLPTVSYHTSPEDVWSSHLDDPSRPVQRIPVCLVDSGDTVAVPLKLAAVLSTGFGFLCFCPTLIPVSPGQNVSSVFQQISGPSYAAFGWAGVCLPDPAGATRSEETFEGPAPRRLPELAEQEVAKHLDWTRLKQPGELAEAILVCSSSTATSQVGLLSATLDSANRVSSSNLNVPLPYRRSQSIPRHYNMYLSIVHDNFPPDPLWIGLLTTSNRSNPKCLPGHHITIGPLIRITNLLPCDLVYYFAGTMVNGSVQAGADACVNELSPAEALRFGVHLDGFPKCEPLTIPPNTYDQKVLLRLQDTLGRPLELQVQVLARAGSARHLTVSAAVWLINQSGLPLIFTQSSSSPGALYNSESARQRALANISAGQYEEHEEARSVSPLLFSFANKNEGYLLRVRVGRGLSKSESTETEQPSGRHGLYPVWSPAISLDKTGVDMLQLKLVDSSNRPGLVYHVGFEVRDGHGRHAVTRIVTFKPRYVIENATDLRLHVAQRKCTRTRSGYSAIAVLDPGGTQAFHWAREDLDRLMCVRAVLNSADRDWEVGRITDERCSLWSGGFQIDRPYSFTMLLHLSHLSEIIKSGATGDSISETAALVDRLFLRVVVVLREATFHVLLCDANALPPPFRIENHSPISVSYQQVLCPSAAAEKTVGYQPSTSPFDSPRVSTHRQTIGSLDDHQPNDVTSENAEWSGGAIMSYLSPAASENYALEEPQCRPVITLRVQGGTSASYNLDKVGLGRPLIYDNFVYLTVLGPLMDTSASSRCDSFSSDFVFDVRPSSHRVVYSSKIPGRRAQLWWLSDCGYIVHEGSSSPLEPGERNNRTPKLSKKQFVLDVDTGNAGTLRDEGSFVLDSDTIRQFEVAQLVVAPLNKRRKNFQTWRIDQHGLLVNSALYCVQVYREHASSQLGGSDFVGTPVLAVKPRPSATRLISPSLAPAIILPLWLRPGSGRLRVYVYLDGVTRVLRIEDEAVPSRLLRSETTVASSSEQQSTPAVSRWGSLMFVDATPKRMSIAEYPAPDRTPNAHDDDYDSSQFRLLVSLPLGIGVSVVSGFAEELVYASLVNVRLSFCRAYSLDVFEKDWQRFSESASPPPPGGLNVAGDMLLSDAVASRGSTPEQPEEGLTEEGSSLNPRRRRSLFDFVRFSVDHVQINSQFPGATLPVLLFTDSPARDLSATGRLSTDVIQGQPLAIQSSEESALQFPPSSSTLSVAYQRQVQCRWNVHLFKTFQVDIGPVIIQAEELLLLKLIQFWQHATSRLSPSSVTTDYADEHPLSRPNFSSTVDNSTLFWFDSFSISLIPLKLSVQTAKKSLTSSNLAGAKRLLPSLMSFSNAEVNLEPLLRSHVLETSTYLLEQVLKHYKFQLRAHAINIFGSVDFLGNPLGFINDMTSGISGLVELDVGGLIRHVAHGVGDSAAKVAGSVSHLLNAISLDEEHQHERAAILGVRPDASPLLEPTRSSQTNLDAYGSETASTYSSDYGVDPLEGFELAQTSELVPSLPIQSGETFAPLAAGFRGLMHGLVGGVTSIVTQPYKGIQEDQFKGFITGVGRGVLGTVTKPLGGFLDLISGVMTTISEATRFSSTLQPRRRRPRRSGLSRYALLPLSVYRLDESVAQLQLHRLTLFTSARGAPQSTRRFSSPSSATSTELLEIGEEVAVEIDESDTQPMASKDVVEALQSISYFVHSTVDGAWLSHRFNYPECVFHVLPVQEGGVVAILTDRAIWCVSSESLGGFVASWPTDSNAPLERQTGSARGPIFCLTEHATLMFMLPYHRLDHVRVRKSSLSSWNSPSSSDSVYVIFTGDSGVSAQQLRCDHLSWAIQLTKRTREAQFRFLQAAFSLFRPELTLTPATVNTTPTGRSVRHGGVPLVPGYPVALAYAPVYR